MPVQNPHWEVRTEMWEMGLLVDTPKEFLLYIPLLISQLSFPNGFRLFPVRSPLLRESMFLSFPRGT